jgi:hypothetical protein
VITPACRGRCGSPSAEPLGDAGDRVRGAERERVVVDAAVRYTIASVSATALMSCARILSGTWLPSAAAESDRMYLPEAVIFPSTAPRTRF